MSLSVSLKGDIKVQRKLKSIKAKEANSKAVFLLANYVETQAKKKFESQTNRITGNGIQSIQTAKLSELSSRVYAGKEYMKIIETGRRAVKAKSGKFLFIPLSPRARKKSKGDSIPKSWEWGSDFVLTKSAKKTKPRPFFRPAIEAGRKKAPVFLSQQLKKQIK